MWLKYSISVMDIGYIVFVINVKNSETVQFFSKWNKGQSVLKNRLNYKLPFQ